MKFKHTKIREFIKKAGASARKHGMFEKGDRVLAGVSGGPDSVALLFFLLEIKEAFRFEKVGVAHLNHMLRGEEADRDQRFVENLAGRLGLDCYTATRDVPLMAKQEGLSTEDAARKARFSFLSSIRKEKGYTRIALGHHADDDAELVLMNLLRGAGSTGLSGIPPVREEKIVRPLIQCTKKEILRFLDLLGQGFVTDSSNENGLFLRNRVRNHLVPILEKEYNPGIRKSLNRLADICKEDNDWMESQITARLEQILLNTEDDRVVFDLAGFNSGHPAEKRRLSRWAIRFVKGDLKRISLSHIDSIRTLAATGEGGRSLDLPGRVRVAKDKNTLVFKKETLPLRELGKQEKRRQKRL
ncbi:MAG: tRNA lysidine(34) synthetase TilS [Desulfarculaceae bacterium]|nr:tRNA lysidine(34) synthetase TilS [Desulfarculaceae bacterium]